MDSEVIRCFQHCDRQKNILCFTVPKLCPVCGADTTQSPMRIPPYLIEAPFTDGSYTQCAVLVKPTLGHFLHDFDNQSDLHIGLTNSKGEIYEFDERGVTVGREGWQCCLSIYIDSNDCAIDVESWDLKLDKFSAGGSWLAKHYVETTYNCYDFVIGFLRHMGLDGDYPCLKSKLDFCETMIVPITSRAGKYISLYRTIGLKGYVVQNV